MPPANDERRSNAVRKTTHYTVNESNQAAYLRFRIDGEPIDCILDTGSEVTLIPFSSVPDTIIIPDDQKLYAANGTSICVMGRAVIEGAIGRRIVTIEGFVTVAVSPHRPTHLTKPLDFECVQ